MGRKSMPSEQKRAKVSFTIKPENLARVREEPKMSRSEFVNNALEIGMRAMDIKKKMLIDELKRRAETMTSPVSFV